MSVDDVGDAVPIFQHPGAEPHRDESSHPRLDDFFGPQPSWEERLAADPELRGRIEKHRARLARRPSDSEVLMRRQRKIRAAVDKAQRRAAEDEEAENDPELRAALVKRRAEEQHAAVEAILDRLNAKATKKGFAVKKRPPRTP